MRKILVMLILLPMILVGCKSKTKVKTTTDVKTEIVRDTITEIIEIEIPVDSVTISKLNRINDKLKSDNQLIQSTIDSIKNERLSIESRLNISKSTILVLNSSNIAIQNELSQVRDSLNRIKTISKKLQFEYDKVINNIKTNTEVINKTYSFGPSKWIILGIIVILILSYFIYKRL